MISEKLGLDDKDVVILSYYMENPMISQSEIAENLKLSQPSVFVRIQKLKKKGLLNYNIGIDFSKTNLFLCRVDLTAKKPNELLDQIKKCPFFVNGYVMSGETNVSIMLVHEDLKKIDEIVNTHLRDQPDVHGLRMNVVVSSAKDFIFQVDLRRELNPDANCGYVGKCKNCSSVKLHVKD
jgi:DNA-binding Lrp family transcriptional regulator